MPSVRLITWNVHELREAEPPHKPFDPAPWLAGEAPDVVCLQEFPFGGASAQAGELGRKIGLPYVASLSYSLPVFAANARAGLVMLSRMPLSSIESAVFTNPADPDGSLGKAGYNKGVLSGVLETDAGPFLVSNVHLFPARYFGIEADDPRLDVVWSELAAVLNRAGQPLRVAAGDFNSRDRKLITGRLDSSPARADTASKLIDDVLVFPPIRLVGVGERKNPSDHDQLVVDLDLHGDGPDHSDEP